MKHVFCLLIVLVFAAGCGKDGGGGGSSYSSNLYNPGLGQGADQTINGFNTWYNTPTEASAYQVGGYTLTKTTQIASSTSTGGGCANPQPIKIFGVIVGYYCVTSGGTTGDSGNSTTIPNVIVVGNVAKSSFAAISAVANNSHGTLVSATTTSTGAGINPLTGINTNFFAYTFRFQKPNGHIKTVVIDTKYPTAFQPMYEHDSEDGKGISVTNIVRTF